MVVSIRKPLRPDESGPADLAFCLRTRALPWFRAAGREVIFSPEQSPQRLSALQAAHGPLVAVRAVSHAQFLRLLEARFRDSALDWATNGLMRRHPELSASRVLLAGQKLGFAISLVALAALFCGLPSAMGLCLAIALAVAFAANALFRVVLVWMGAESDTPQPLLAREEDLPRYSIIVPLYREANVVPTLIGALEALDYPADRLEILLVAEGDDHETLAALRTMASAPQFVVLSVPPGFPRTKPKAANYALSFVSGDFTVIYDAEDRPEPDQLRKAVAAFREAPERVVCLQARLNFFNAQENLLTRLFALDYALWFDFLLPGLDRLHIPMPLGGTSNHFRTAALREIAGWDPYNVTEDADLGIRLARLGLRVATLDSTTYEEATVDFGNWLRQRSRWMKGYMQTWLVHMRNPLHLLRHAGPAGFLGFQLFVGGTVLTALVNPLLWAMYLYSLVTSVAAHADLLGTPVGLASMLGLLTGNALFAYLAMLGPYRRGWLELTPYGFLAPVYWLLISLAGYRGLLQLVRRPWHWDKTSHGRTRHRFAVAPRGDLIR